MKLLVVSYTFPPIAGGLPRLIAYLVKFLVKQGHSVDVLTIHPCRYHPIYQTIPETLSIIPPEVRIYRTYAGIIHHMARFIHPYGRQIHRELQDKKNVKLNLRVLIYELGKSLLIPDGTVDWLPFGLLAGRKLIHSNQYDCIFSIGGPVTAHFISWYLSGIAKIPWIAHIGDPWSFNPSRENLPAWRQTIDRWFEGILLHRVSKLLVTTKETMIGYLSKFTFLTKNKVDILSLGIDLEKYELIKPENRHDNKFRLVYTGIFYDTQNPYNFFDALSDFCKIYNNIEMIIAGNIGSAYQNYISNLNLSNIVIFRGYQPYDKIIALQKSADFLLLFGSRGGYQCSQKIYEYFAAKRPIFVIKSDNRDVAGRLVKESKSGLVVKNDKAAINAGLERVYSLWRTNQIKYAFSFPSLREYTFEEIAKKLENILYEVSHN